VQEGEQYKKTQNLRGGDPKRAQLQRRVKWGVGLADGVKTRENDD